MGKQDGGIETTRVYELSPSAFDVTVIVYIISRGGVEAGGVNAEHMWPHY